MKEFNTTGVCLPSKHYMVDLTERVEAIKRLVDAGKYFAINRARQYGKTTTLNALGKRLLDSYYVISMDFQDYGEDTFQNADSFCRDFANEFCSLLSEQAASENHDFIASIQKIFEMSENIDKPIRLFTLFRSLRQVWEAADKPIVLMIDEVDRAVNNQLFLDFLAQLRSSYLNRDTRGIKSFQSVILAGVTDIRHLKIKLRSDEEHKENSPWNIASDFDIEMNLSRTGIKEMLDEYEADHNTGMDTDVMAGLIWNYTNGYPFLVSRLCQILDIYISRNMSLADTWTRTGLDEGVKMLLSEDNSLFQSITKNLNNYTNLKTSIRSILMEGIMIPYNVHQRDISVMHMCGLIRNDHNAVRISNRIFETLLYNLFLSDDELKHNVFNYEGDLAKNRFVKNGILNMRLIMEHFIQTYIQVFGPLEERFKEKDGREHFLLYLKPIINGTGNYYIEAQTRNQTRTDVIVDYLGRQYIIELKIWRGERYNENGEKQLSEYLDYFQLDVGYMLSFNFNKKKKTGVKKVEIGDKILYEGTL